MLQCEICDKDYKTERGFKAHMKNVDPLPSAQVKAGTSALANDALNEDVEDIEGVAELSAVRFLDWGEWSGTDDEEEIESYCHLIIDPWREEEEEETRREARAGLATVEDCSSAKSSKATPVPHISCKDCGSGFTTLESFIKHRVGHGMQAAVLRLPPMEDILKECPELARAVCSDMQVTKLKEGFALTVKSLSSELEKHCDTEVMASFYQSLCEKLLSFIPKSNFLYPSAFANAFFTNSSVIIVDKELRATLLCTLSSVIELGPNVSNIFLTNLITKFSSKLLAYLIRIMSKGVGCEFQSLENRYAVTYQSTVSTDFKQNMHYIGGSNVKSILRTALRVKHRSEEWHRLIATLRKQFIISEFSRAPEPELMAWTESLDRGRLTKISDTALEFFVQLGAEVKPLERLDGSLHNNEVMETVIKSPMLLLRWDQLKESLTEKESFKLLHAITYQFCVTWRNGIVGRRVDEMTIARNAPKFGTGGVAFRATLGGK